MILQQPNIFNSLTHTHEMTKNNKFYIKPDVKLLLLLPTSINFDDYTIMYHKVESLLFDDQLPKTLPIFIPSQIYKINIICKKFLQGD